MPRPLPATSRWCRWGRRQHRWQQRSRVIPAPAGRCCPISEAMRSLFQRWRHKAALATWAQARRRARRPLFSVAATNLNLAWVPIKTFKVSLQVGRLALWKFASFGLRYRLYSTGVWTDMGSKTVFSPTLLSWSILGMTEDEDYVFELTVTEKGGVATVTEDMRNIGAS